ncbi:MAG: M48 family metalloprotease [Moorellales bacterium]
MASAVYFLLYLAAVLVVLGFAGFFVFVGVGFLMAVAFREPSDATAVVLTVLVLAVWVGIRYWRLTAVPRDVKEEPLGDEDLRVLCRQFGTAPVRMSQLTGVSEVNAWALPRAVLVSRGWVELAYRDPSAARGILAHEVAHLALGHPRLRGLGAAVFGVTEDLAGHLLAQARAHAGVKALGGALKDPNYAGSFGPAVAGAGGLFGVFHALVGWAGLFLAKPWIRQAEYEADALAARMGYGEDVCRALELLGLAGPEEVVPAGAPAFGRDVFGGAGFHPGYAQRLDRLRRLGLVPSRAASDRAVVQAEAGQPRSEPGQPEPEPEPRFEPEAADSEPNVVVLPRPEFLARAAAREAERVRGVVGVRARAAEGLLVLEVLVAPDLSAAGAGAVARRAAARAEKALEALGARCRLELRYDWAPGLEGE